MPGQVLGKSPRAVRQGQRSGVWRQVWGCLVSLGKALPVFGSPGAGFGSRSHLSLG